MIAVIRTDSSNPHFQELVKELDKELAIRDGDDHAFYAQFNKTVNIGHCIVAYKDEVPVGIGALRQFADETMEVKRMYVPPAHRAQGIASKVLEALESWARELGYKKCVLETGMNQPEAIKMYHKSGYHRIANYGQYAGVNNSVCFEKEVG
jgi:putative acetyltransferase